VNKFLIAPILILLTLLAACVQQPATPAKPFTVADVFVTSGRLLATAELSPTPVPTPTFANNQPTIEATLPLPTVVVLVQPTLPMATPNSIPGGAAPPPILPTPRPTALACAITPPLPFAAFWQNVPAVQNAMRCPTGQPSTEGGVYQSFERGVMFWRESDHSIFVISFTTIMQGQATDHWWRMADTWTDAEPVSDPALQPPAGMSQPVRGFGKVWRANGFVRESLGWAIAEEIRTDSQWLAFEGGFMMSGPGGTPLFALSPQDAGQTAGTHTGPLK
jgi:hypothetical protein